MTGDIFIYGGIGTEAGEVSFEYVNSQILANKDSKELVVHIISPGGDVFEGQSIYNALKNTGKKITMQIEGVCASIATLIAGAGTYIVMNRNAQWMIHNPNIDGLRGDARKLRSVANQLDQIKTLLIDVYDRKTTLGKEKLWELYDNETWLTAQQAKEMGFVDDTQDAIKAVAKISQLKIQNEMEETKLEKMFSRFTNLFKSLRVKNQATDTLDDGRVIVIMAETEEWVGAQVMLETGEPLPAGDYTLASGKTIKVDENFLITAVGEAAPANNDQEMEKDNKIKELESQLAAAMEANKTATAAVETAKAEAVSARAESAKITAKVEKLEGEFNTLKELASKTIGDTTAPKVDPSIRNGAEGRPFDPMAEQLGQAYITSRPSNYNNRK